MGRYLSNLGLCSILFIFHPKHALFSAGVLLYAVAYFNEGVTAFPDHHEVSLQYIVMLEVVSSELRSRRKQNRNEMLKINLGRGELS